MRIGILSVVYPGVEAYLHDFFSSLERQTDRNYTLYLINDGMTGIEYFLNTISLPVKVREEKGSAATLRKVGIEWLLAENIEAVVFADADDYFAENRIEVSINKLASSDLVFNELFLVGNEFSIPIPMIGGYFQDGQVMSAKSLEDANCMGLSNTAAWIKVLECHLQKIPDDIIAFDWALFVLCIHSGARAIFTENTKSYYRQHGDNIAYARILSEKWILRGVRVKRDHYNLISQYYEEYTGRAKLYQSLWRSLNKNASLREEYCEAIRRQSSNIPLWWEQIRSLEELGI